MAFQEFLEKWNGKYCDVAGSANAKNQCVDLVNAYIRDVLNQPIIEWTNAKDFPSKVGDKYEYILNTPQGIPQEGDFVIWGGIYGHIAIFIEGNINNFRSFDQNYPSGTPCHIQNHTTYNNILGWLRFKSTITTSNDNLQKCLANLEQERKWKNETYNQLQEVITELESIQSQVTTHQEFQKQIAITLKIENQPSTILGEIMKLIKLEDRLRDEQRKSSTCENTLAGKDIEIEQLEKTMKDTTLENKSLLDTKENFTRKITALSEKIEKLEKAKRLNILFKVFGLYICKEKKEEVKENDPS